MSDVLIVGYGKAGKRHAQIAQSLGLDVKTVDPLIDSGEVDYAWMDHALVDDYYPLIVIASPPDDHLYQIRQALEHQAYVLCEKPLCGIGQIQEAEELWADFDLQTLSQIMVAYNYRFHPEVLSVAGALEESDLPYWNLRCAQHRPDLPHWGLLLDHVSHDIDILRFASKTKISIASAIHMDTNGVEAWLIRGKAGREGRFFLSESVDKDRRIGRRVDFRTPRGTVQIGANADMYLNMWKSFLDSAKKRTETAISYIDALETQRVLEDIHDVSKWRV